MNAIQGHDMKSSSTGRLRTASLLLAAGSGVLLLGVLSYLWTDRWSGAGSAWFWLVSWLGVLVQAMGLVFLFFGILEAGPEPLFQRMLSLYAASLLFVVLGLLTLPVFFPNDSNTWSYFPSWLGFFPHVPTVFGPAVCAHGTMFVLASRDFARQGSRVAAGAGGGVLFLLGAAGFAFQVSIGVPPAFPTPLAPFSFLAGLTVLGYALIAGGFQLEITPRETRAGSQLV